MRQLFFVFRQNEFKKQEIYCCKKYSEMANHNPSKSFTSKIYNIEISISDWYTYFSD